MNNDLRNKQLWIQILDFLFSKCQTHAYTRFENGCSENSTQKVLTKYSTEENNKHFICRPRSVRIGKNCALGLRYGPTSGTVFPNTDLRPANNIYVLSILALQFRNYVKFNFGKSYLSSDSHTNTVISDRFTYLSRWRQKP